MRLSTPPSNPLAPRMTGSSALSTSILRCWQTGSSRRLTKSSSAYIQGTLRERPGSRERNLPFLESFVRPAGLDRPATPAAVDAIEALAAEKGR